MDDDNEVRRIAAHEIGMVLDTLSIGELEERIGLLEGEIERLKSAISQKKASKDAADSVFKFR